MKKSWISVSLAVLLAVFGAAGFTRCGSDGFGVSGVIDAADLEIDIEGILDDMADACAGGCDGSFTDDEPAALSAGKDINLSSDTSAILYLIYDAFYAVDAYDFYYYGPDLVDDDGGDDFKDQFTTDDLVPEAGEGEDPNFLPIAITASATIPCGASAADGTIHVNDTLVSALNEGENIEDAGYEAGTTVITFGNCLIEGDFVTPPEATGLSNTDEQSLRASGTIVYTWVENDDAETYRETFTGTLNLTERDLDTETTGLQDFWTSPVVFNHGYREDEGGDGPNGGFCVGAGVNLGVEDADDPYDDGDDGCNEDSDEGAETFFTETDFWDWWYD